MDRRLLAALVATILSCLPPRLGAQCDWKAGHARDVVRSLYLGRVLAGDDSEAGQFPLLRANAAAEYRCLVEVFDSGPQIIPGFENDYRQNVEDYNKHFPASRTEVDSPKTGIYVLPAMTFLEPRAARELGEARVARGELSDLELAYIAHEIWPRRSRVARDALRKRLTAPPLQTSAATSLLEEMVRFGRSEDAAFTEARLIWAVPTARRRLHLSLLAKNGHLASVLRVLKTSRPPDQSDAAQALLTWGHVDEVCSALAHVKTGDSASAIGGRYAMFKSGGYFSWLPDDVIARLQAAPQAWECLPKSLPKVPSLEAHDFTADPAATWSRPELGGDAPAPARKGKSRK